MRELCIPVSLTFLICLILIPLIMLVCRHYSLYDPVNARKIHSGNIPRLGGIGIVLAFFAGVFVYAFFYRAIPLQRIVPLLMACLLIFFAGILDDLKNLNAYVKLFVQIAAGLVVITNGYRFTTVMRWTMPDYAGGAVTLLWIIGIINAYNLIDGLDGLCGGISFLTFITLGFLYFMVGDRGVGLCFIMCAALFAFLIYNKPQAKIFMGDSGSQFLGFMIAVIPLYLGDPNFEYNKILVLVDLVSVPMIDTFAAIWRRVREHRSIMSPDRSHIHHKLLNIGFTKVQALIILLTLQILVCLSVVCAVYIKRSHGSILLILAFLFIILFYTIIHYANRAVVRKSQIKEE